VSGGFPAAVGLGVAAALVLWWGIQAHALLEQARRSVLDML
jgi:hypothetical protein